MRKYEFDLESIELSASTIAQYDCLLLATDHEAFDYELIEKHAALLVDARGKFRGTNTSVIRA